MRTINYGLIIHNQRRRTIRNGLTIHDPGVRANHNGLTIHDPGMSTIHNGLTIHDPGMRANHNGLTIHGPRMRACHNGLTIHGHRVHKQQQLCRSCDYTAKGCGRSTLPWVYIIRCSNSVGVAISRRRYTQSYYFHQPIFDNYPAMGNAYG